MKRIIAAFAAASLFLILGVSAGIAQEEGKQMDPATPVELFACKYNDGKGPADLDAAAATWNKWADDAGIDDYSAWTLVPYYSSPEQDFDFLWLGGSSSAKSLGSIQDNYIANAGDAQKGFNDAISCDAHVNYATLQFKTPPKREDPSKIVISFSDCNMADGVAFSDLAPALSEWADYKEEQGSTSGMWVLFPAYGGGGDEFDFKFIGAWQNLEEQGADWDQYSAEGRKKAAELFAGKVDCDASRVYLTKNRRMGSSDDE